MVANAEHSTAEVEPFSADESAVTAARSALYCKLSPAIDIFGCRLARHRFGHVKLFARIAQARPSRHSLIPKRLNARQRLLEPF